MTNEDIDIENDTDELGKKILELSVINGLKRIKAWLNRLTDQVVGCNIPSTRAIFVIFTYIKFIYNNEECKNR